ncbi:hypothetical protein C8F01DRAFT_1160255 [Mycena amicta]|nr:hypothetical protein C8F01DRAFT_1160255 [Mycena amicta]
MNDDSHIAVRTPSSTPNISCASYLALPPHVRYVCGHHGRSSHAPALDHAHKNDDVAEVLAAARKGDWHKPVPLLPDISVSNGAVYGFLSEHGGSRYSLSANDDPHAPSTIHMGGPLVPSRDNSYDGLAPFQDSDTCFCKTLAIQAVRRCSSLF